MNPEILKLQEEINRLSREVEQLRSSTTIPYLVQEAFKKRLIEPLPKVRTQALPVTVSPTAHNQAVNEAGVATYSVLGIPTGYLEIVISENTYYIPYY